MTTLLVASTGGHLKQLHQLHRRLAGIEGPFRWVTFDTPQSRSLLAEADVDFVRFVGGRDPVNVIRNIAPARRILSERAIDTLVSTGSAVAFPFFALARLRGLDCHYIESAARSDRPSMTGSLVSQLPRVKLYTQYPGWTQKGWVYGGSVFDSFESASTPEIPPSQITNVVVTLGTYRGYGFRRLLQRLLALLPRDASVLWQTGDTDTTNLDIDGQYALPERDLIDAMREADLVVSHAGVGTALAAMEAGKCPVLVPRRLSHHEHVDDHQIQVAAELRRRGLSISIDVEDLGCQHLLSAAARRIVTRSTVEPFLTRVI
jgi:UDP-N-acetylglucosamine--N-acetylmuramyl-(pentapeptide) pyrophosphoryl-undecaprenol N-acetylglucosamine transferase